MASFKVAKGGKFAVDKGIQHVRLAIGWNESKLTKPVDVDVHAFGCVHSSSGIPSFYNDGSHALTYANSDLVKGKNKSFSTQDGSMTHSGDNRTGAGDGDDEEILIFLSKLPAEIAEIMVFVTIHEAKIRNQHFGLVENAFMTMFNQDTGEELCSYSLSNEFDGAVTIQVGSLVKNGDSWTFNAVGAGTPNEELGDILEKLS